MDIRTVTAELLRAGPRHNQLLSPLTQYLGVCGDNPAGTVTLPFEHSELEHRLQELSYRVAADDETALTRRRAMLDGTGREMADVLSGIPGLSGALGSETAQAQTLTQLRIVLSASELAMLPFELSKALAGAGSSGVWLALKARAPVCITRRIRSVSAGMRWPTNPRVLFIAGPNTPIDGHRQALQRATEPWRDPEDASRSDPLVVVETASIARIEDKVAAAAQEHAPFTHIHILAHGVRLDEADRYSPIGVALFGESVPGRRLASALTSVTDDGVRCPSVVTLATCDSAAVPDVRTPGASVAHDLHDHGIPLVVASQFPLSVEGSIPFVDCFYRGQLWGGHPLVSLYDTRLRLHSRMGPEVHDWASLVVYEAFPTDLPDQLEELRYWQVRRAQDLALRRLEKFASAYRRAEPGNTASGSHSPVSSDRTAQEQRYEELVANVNSVSMRFPERGPYALECAGLRAAGCKRLAQAAFQLAVARDVSTMWRRDLLTECLGALNAARIGYWRATKSFLGASSDPTRTKANLHWLLGQVLSLDVVLGRPLDTASWTAAHLAATIDTDNSNDVERAWANVSLSELALLRLADEKIQPDKQAELAEEALAHADRVVELLGRGSEHAKTTSRQFERYIDCWGNPELAEALAELGIPERASWGGEHGLVATARRLVDRLRGQERPAPPPAPSHGRAGPAPAAPSSGALQASPVKAKTISASSHGSAQTHNTSSLFSVEMLPAENGDCLWIEYGDPMKPRRILVDCGAKSTTRTVASRIKKIGKGATCSFELFVLTHIDADHINGVLPLFEDGKLPARFEDIWFNGWRQVSQFLSVQQGEAFSKLLEDPGRMLPWNRAFGSANATDPASIVITSDKPLPSFSLADGMRLTLLSPGPAQLERLGQTWSQALTKLRPKKAMLGRKSPPPVQNLSTFDLEALARKPVRKDTSSANGSSIALLTEFDGRSILLTGDAHADVLAQSIKDLQRERGREGEKLKLDALKLSHHGAANATTLELLNCLNCQRFLVSSNGNIFNHPDREAIARVIVTGGVPSTLCFNYRSPLNALWDEHVLRDRYGYVTVYPQEGSDGLQVLL